MNLSILKDESFISKSIEYLNSYKQNKQELIQKEKEYLLKCNEKTFFEERLKILKKVKSSLKKENPLKDNCPTCKQSLPSSIENLYEYFQDVNNTDAEIEKTKGKLVDLQSSINSIEGKINIQKEIVANDYSLLLKYKIDELSFGTWLDNKTKVTLSENITIQIGEAESNLRVKTEALKKFKTDNEIINIREFNYSKLNDYFEDNLDKLGVKKFEDYKYTKLLAGSFPKQGVELLKTMLAYYFAFNKVIQQTEYVHRFPFLLDAIFKEDIDENNRKLILEFIYKNRPKNEQIIFSFAESDKNTKTATQYNNDLMNNEAKLILTDLTNERSILKPVKVEQTNIIQETLKFIE